MITGPDGAVEVIVSLQEYQQLEAAREELHRLRGPRGRGLIAEQLRKGMAQFATNPEAFRRVEVGELLCETGDVAGARRLLEPLHADPCVLRGANNELAEYVAQMLRRLSEDM
ncbi:hypothetical protein AB0H00_26400 [Nocardia sp. NPDC023852]|uniref:hypothetical protein n=1 Tax=Nocardia sp. NPDC023852 TaxID=3154697 RepID=UPI0033E041D3